MKTHTSDLQRLLAQLLGLLKWLGFALCVAVWMVVGSALLIVVLLLLYMPLYYLGGLMESWGWGAWVSEPRAASGYLLLLLLGGWLAFRRWGPKESVPYGYSDSEWAELKRETNARARETRVERWMNNGPLLGLVAGIVAVYDFESSDWAEFLRVYLRHADQWWEEVLSGWTFLILLLVPTLILLLIGIVVGRLAPRYVSFVMAAVILWIGFCLFLGLLGVGGLFSYLALAVFVTGGLLGREIGWISAVITNGLEDRRAHDHTSGEDESSI